LINYLIGVKHPFEIYSKELEHINPALIPLNGLFSEEKKGKDNLLPFTMTVKFLAGFY